MADDVERTEQPTPKRRADARSEGQIAVSQEAFTLANLLAVSLALSLSGQTALTIGVNTARELWLPRDDLDVAGAWELLSIAARAGAIILVPILAATALAAIAVGELQTRGNVATKRLAPSFARLSPGENIRRVFQRQAVIELPKSLFKILLVTGVIWFAVRSRLREYLGLMYLPLPTIVGFLLSTVLDAFMAGCAALLPVSLADYAYQRWQTERALRMTKAEIKEERRQTEGDPLMRARVRSMQYERARTRMMKAVPSADVVVTNPDHISIALAYDRAEMAAPKVVARGAGLLALRIREIAREHGVPIVENKPLARALYRSARVGEYVPERFYRTVAEVLAYVYRLDPRRSRAW